MLIELVIATLNREEKLKRLIGSIIRNNFSDTRIVIYPDYKQEDIVRIYNRHLEKFDADAFAYLGDDLELYPDCLKNAAECLIKKFPDLDGVVKLNQVNISAAKCPWALIGKNFIKRYKNNWVCCPDYTHFWFDAEIGLYAQELGKLVFCKEAKLMHYHPSFFSNEMDETHKIARRNKDMEDKVYQERRKRNWLWGRDFNLING
ncbi:MAG: glycosyltransferase family 2 protein [Candidatus Omnitrophota bacterium]